MFHEIKLKYLNNRNTFKIMRFTLISIVLLIVTWLIDYRYPSTKSSIPDILLLSSEVSSSFLSTLSGTFLTVTTFTFTTILTVIGKYSGSFSPRIVQDFIEKPNVLSLIGIYTGGFFYTVLALFMVQNIKADVPLLCGTIAVFYAIAAMIAFVLFVRRVLTDIKVGNVIEHVYETAAELVEEEAEKRKASELFREQSGAEEIKIYAEKTGFLYEIDHRALLSKLKDRKCELVIEKRIGEYLPKGMYIAKLIPYEPLELVGEEKDDFLSKLASNLLINVKKNDFTDYHHEFMKLTEIAMMALSPGINDPNTAIEAIRKISVLLGKLFSTENAFVVLAENENCKIVYSGYSVEEELYAAFSQILFYGKTDPMVARAILDGVYLIYMLAEESVRGKIKACMDAIYTIVLDAMTTNFDRDAITAAYEDFCQNRDDRFSAEIANEA